MEKVFTKKVRKISCLGQKMMNKADWDDLPKVIVILVMEKLVMFDRFRMSLCNKSWQQCFHDIENTQEFLPWVMSYKWDQTGDGGGIFKLFDPALKRSITLNEEAILKNRDFCYAEPCHSRKDWVLFSKPCHDGMFFFFYNPFINEVIRLPKMEMKFYIPFTREIKFTNRKTMFSLSPSFPDCMVISVSIPMEGKLKIETCHPGDKSWKMFEFSGEYHQRSGMFQLAYKDGFFYCIFVNRKIGVFNIKQQEWKLLSEPSPDIYPRYQYLVDGFNGDLLLLTHGKLSFWRFDISKTKWVFVEDESLKKLVFFKDKTPYLLSVPAVGNATESAGKIYYQNSPPTCELFYLTGYRGTFSEDYKSMETTDDRRQHILLPDRLQHIWIQPPFQSF